MTVLSRELIQKFYSGLSACRSKSTFDIDFLERFSLEDLYNHEIEILISLFKSRLQDLVSTEYDWTRIGISGENWAKEKYHANYHWFELAKNIKINSHKHITEIIFPGIEIAVDDLKWLDSVGSFGALFYDDSFKRLIFLNRVVKIAEKKTILFAIYDKDANEYPISINELAQIYDKLKVPKKQGQLKSWNEFRQKYLGTWSARTEPSKLTDLMYPLFNMVNTYFSEVNDADLQGSTQVQLKQFYQNNLRGLKIEDANCFYGQPIRIDASEVDPLYLSELMIKLMRAQDDLNSVLPLMVKLAVWITMQNPAMLIDHPMVDALYQNNEMGPYFTLIKLADELKQLLSYQKELDSVETEAIRALRDKLRSVHIEDDSWFIELFNIFSERDRHNKLVTFMDIARSGPLTGSFEYVYNRSGANAQYIRIAQLLSGWGVLRRYQIEDYFLLLMQELESPVDSVTGELLSSRPLSHYVRPEHDRTYLALLDNSEENYHVNMQCFYDVNRENSAPFSVRDYEYIKAYSAPKFRQYPRVPLYSKYPLKNATLQALVDLVNHSLHHEAAQDGDGYALRKGISHSHLRLPEKVIEYELSENNEWLTYQVRDSWRSDIVHNGTISLASMTDRQIFFAGTDYIKRLMFILHTAIVRGHARPNLTIGKYFNAYAAYDEFREYCEDLRIVDPDELVRLNNVSMRYGNAVRTFGEVWLNGFPDCMSAASKWFSTLILDYLPEVEFVKAIENAGEDSKYLRYARRDSQRIYEHFTTYELARSFTDSLKRNRVLGRQPLTPEIAGMLTITDSGSRVRSQVNQFSLFGSQNKLRQHLRAIPVCIVSSREGRGSSECSSGHTSDEGSSVASSIDSVLGLGSTFFSSYMSSKAPTLGARSPVSSSRSGSVSEDSDSNDDVCLFDCEVLGTTKVGY